LVFISELKNLIGSKSKLFLNLKNLKKKCKFNKKKKSVIQPLKEKILQILLIKKFRKKEKKLKKKKYFMSILKYKNLKKFFLKKIKDINN
jgi:hypothetical protein